MISFIRSGIELPRPRPAPRSTQADSSQASSWQASSRQASSRQASSGQADRGRSGVAVTRKLWPSERQAFLDHLLRLDPDTRRQRFGSSVNDGFLIRYAETTFGVGGLVYAYLEDDIVRGAAELRGPDDARDRRAEAAFSVEAGWRQRGIGSALFASLIRAAGNRRVSVLDIVCLPHNQAMRNLAAKFDVEVTLQPDGITGSLRIDRPSVASLAAEAVDDMVGIAAAALAAQKRAWRRLQGGDRAA